MSKISYRDKIILLSFLVIVILVGGFFLLIKPKNEELKANETEYDKLKTKLESLEKQADQIYEIQEHIVVTHDESLTQAESFSEIRQTDVLDEYVESTLLNLYNDAGEVSGLKVSPSISYTNPSTATLTYYYYTPSVLTYPIYTAADLNGEFTVQATDALAKSAAISARTAQTVVASTVTLSYEGTESELTTFLDLIADSEEKVLLNAIDFTSETITYELDGATLKETECELTGSLTFQFYSAQVADLLYDDLFKETSDGDSSKLEELVEKYKDNFKTREEAKAE